MIRHIFIGVFLIILVVSVILLINISLDQKDSWQSTQSYYLVDPPVNVYPVTWAPVPPPPPGDPHDGPKLNASLQ